ncbi:hypothetical protein CFR78_12465 [Komagataeibacter rhaeticus]|nr:hypothetical protein GLUCORHAEAF1_12270 [Komagataeibacter rhaeticus AF1]PYD52888.1 hypothetical protein CFR78_12465 [Komagataeibacter rhaeticus]
MCLKSRHIMHHAGLAPLSAAIRGADSAGQHPPERPAWGRPHGHRAGRHGSAMPPCGWGYYGFVPDFRRGPALRKPARSRYRP